MEQERQFHEQYLDSEALIAVAIQFDLETSSWAFSSRYEFEHDFNIHGRYWYETDTGSLASIRIPSSVLVKPDGKSLHSFGAAAQQQYASLEQDGRHKQYYFFKTIAKELANNFREKCESQVFINDEMGKPLPALTVFSLALSFFKEDILERFDKTNFNFDNDAYVVLTVPEEFQDVGAIDFMRTAASKAGFNAKSLSVVTEVDAVSIYYQHISSNQTSGEEPMFKCTTGMKYMLVNAGGCSTNIAVHEMVRKGIVKESTVVSINKGGCSMALEAFEDFCRNLVSKDVFEIFKSASEEDWSDMKRDWLEMKEEFESKLGSVSPTHTSTVRMHFPAALHDLYKREICTSLKAAVRASKFSEDVTFIADKIAISSTLFFKFISPAVERVILDIRLALENSAVTGIIIFGPFTKLPMFREAVHTSFHDVKIMLAPAETMAALKGSVIIGLSLGFIQKIERVHYAAVVAAIDFGTTYSGWAYSLRTDFEADRTKAYSKFWNSGSTQTEKTPTCILIQPDGQTVEAFGYDAEDRYRDLTDSGEHVNYYYFRRFKMLLNRKLGEKLNRHITIEDEMNRSLPALDVFAMSIRFLKDDFLGAVQKSISGGIRKQDVNWVLTVPAIWTDGSKQFMREAAIKAGIERRRLTIALEPEAASMYCRHLPVEATVKNTSVNIASFQAGTRYMILDAGGGTIDITVHEVDTDNGVKEVHAACGGGWGGTTVDEEFKNLLIDLLTENVYMQFKLENTDDWCDLWRDFEVTKRAITTAANAPVRMRLPQSLGERVHQLTKSRLSDVISGSRFANDIDLVRDKVKFSPKMAKSWFHISVDKTTALVRSILSRDVDITAILMVGGFSESPVLQEAVRSAFTNIEVVIPREASYSILKGALIFGHLPKVVTERVLKYTYGISSYDNFVEGKHPEKRRVRTDYGIVCQNVFSKHVEIHQRVRAGEQQIWHTYHPQFKSQTQMEISVYASEEPNPLYTDQGCHFVGKLSIDLADHDGTLDREILVALTFSGTEIVVEAKDKKTGNNTYAAIDFLG